MKKIVPLAFILGMVAFACQKQTTDPAPVVVARPDSTILAGDTVTYEVITTDTVGWFGIWSQPDGVLASNVLDSVSYGSPVYFPSGWKYTFINTHQSFKAMISVATHLYSDDITVNLYNNSRLVKSVKNDAMKGVAKLMADINKDTLTGTVAMPVLTYEVLLSEPDTTKFQFDGWIGHWIKADGTYCNNPDNLLWMDFAIPSGWKYSFKPDHLPFTMKIQAAPYTLEGAKITVNLLVNGQLVKSSASRVFLPDTEYTVQ